MNMSSKAHGRRHFFGPDLLRLVAALLVVLFHFSEMDGTKMGWPAPDSAAPMSWLGTFAWFG